MSNFKQGVNSLQTEAGAEAVAGLLFRHKGATYKQGVNSLLTDAGAEAVGAPIQAYGQLR
jgi:hypothetical protein